MECLFTPFGTILGLLTIVLLTRASVQQLFCPDRLAKESSC
jgi:hypothetical protein